MYRRANLNDIDEIMKIVNIPISEEEIKQSLNSDLKYLYVYENEKDKIVGATLFGADSVDDDDYDSEIYGIFAKKNENEDVIKSEILFETKKELFEKGYRSLIVWCDDNDEHTKKFLRSSGGREAKKRENNKRIEIAYTYELYDYPDLEK